MSDAAPISLYLDLEKGQMPDLEVVARAALAWNDLIKEVIAVIDPSLEVRVDFLSGTIGSRSINSILRTATKVAIEHPWTAGPLAAIVGVFLLAPINHVADDLTDYAMKEWLNHEDSQLTDGDVDRIAKAVAATQRNQVAVELKREVYRQVERNPAITGIGATPIIGQRPHAIVPRSAFPSRVGGDEVILDTAERRTTWKRNYPVTIIRSYSKAEERRWRFEHDGAEFSATMRDPHFLAALKTGHTGIEIGEGIEIRIDLRTKEERVSGVWQTKEQDVMLVVYPVIDRQISLQFPPDQPDEAGQ